MLVIIKRFYDPSTTKAVIDTQKMKGIYQFRTIEGKIKKHLLTPRETRAKLEDAEYMCRHKFIEARENGQKQVTIKY